MRLTVAVLVALALVAAPTARADDECNLEPDLPHHIMCEQGRAYGICVALKGSGSGECWDELEQNIRDGTY